VRRVPTPPTASSDASARAEDPDAPLLAALRAGDEQAFATLVTRYHATLRRVARSYVSTDAVAEDVVQETWLAVIGGLDRFEQRATLKTWLFHILMNKAKTRGVRERRSVPFASLARAGGDVQVLSEPQAPSRGRFTRSVRRDASGRSVLEWWEIHGAGHAWSGGSTAGSFTDPSGPDATREMLRFFLEHARPAD